MTSRASKLAVHSHLIPKLAICRGWFYFKARNLHDHPSSSSKLAVIMASRARSSCLGQRSSGHRSTVNITEHPPQVASWYPLGPSTSITSQLNSYVVGQAVQRELAFREEQVLHPALAMELALQRLGDLFISPTLVSYFRRGPQFRVFLLKPRGEGSHSLQGSWCGPSKLRALYKRALWWRRSGGGRRLWKVVGIKRRQSPRRWWVVVAAVVIRVRVKAVVKKEMMKMSHKRLVFEDDCFWIVGWWSISFALFIS
ncbi:hypothetical protein NL676_009387 [Syzygium grande]|nr:hypothetical protein NL676_009387 [Syzygium grande]